ncbi:diaminohydroxyphosphoribosylamino-pyrimidine deaminase [Mycena floridula]|nr:diaminohydroxyphosphoribosylamino-pyrimidine deaminase [Mycena floridula]
MSNDEIHLNFLRMALAEAEKCEPTPTAFCVGCVLTARWPTETSEPVVIATGYSRELAGNTHAEANALSKSRELNLSELFPAQTPQIEQLLAVADVYTTMEPCSIRTSGLAPCADALLLAKVKRCYIGVAEPDDFVKCEGTQKLKDGGVQVFYIKGLEEECLRVARRGH